MEPTDRDTEEYFEALAGRRDGGPGAAALREALQAQARTLREAEQAQAADLTTDEKAKMDSLKLRLQAAGAFRPAPVAPARPSLGARIRQLLLGDSWQRPVAIAAGVVLASVLALRLVPSGDDDDPSRTLRGQPARVISVPDPQARVAELEKQLQAAGAEVLSAPISADEWTLVVRVPDAGRLAAVQQLLRAAGFKVEGAPPYELGVRGPKK